MVDSCFKVAACINKATYYNTDDKGRVNLTKKNVDNPEADEKENSKPSKDKKDRKQPRKFNKKPSSEEQTEEKTEE